MEPRFSTRAGALTAVLLWAAVAVAPTAGAASFHSFGVVSDAYGVSADGSAVVGFIVNEAFRWTAAGGMTLLGTPQDGSSAANAVSADGSVVVGRVSDPNLGQRAFRWTAGTGIVLLPGPSGPSMPNSEAHDVSDDGSVVVGRNATNSFRWSAATGTTSLGALPGANQGGLAHGISADGSVIVGGATSVGGSEAYRWTAGTGMVGLGDLPGSYFSSQAFAVSGDGQVAVGAGTSDASAPEQLEAFRWTAAGGMVGLGDLTGGAFQSRALGASGDGSLVVGLGSDGAGVSAFVWDPTHGMRPLLDVLQADYGLALTGWRLISANAISDDGRTIVGVGRNPSGGQEGWVAVIPEPATAFLLGTGLALLASARRR